MKFVFDRLYYGVPDQGDICSGYYYKRSKYIQNVASGTAGMGIIGHGSLFLDIFQSDTPYETILTDDITDEDNLLYLVEPWPNFGGIIDNPEYALIRHPHSWHIPIGFIPERIKELARAKRLIILYHIPEYTWDIKKVLDNVNEALTKADIPKDQFKYISGMKHPEMYFWPSFEYSQKLCNNWADHVREVNLEKREKKFTCLNRLDRIHRRANALNFWKNDIIKDGYFSYSSLTYTYAGDGSLAPTNTFKTPMHGYDWGITPDEWTEFMAAGPWVADDLTIEEHNYHWVVHTEHYANAYWNIINETGIIGGIFMTEKTWKPVANLQPFILIGAQGSLKLLHDLGYKTFGDYIDESYDDIEDPVLRVKAASNEAVKLAKQSDDYHIELMHELRPILEHNQFHFLNPKHRIKNFVKYIEGSDPSYNWLKDCKYD